MKLGFIIMNQNTRNPTTKKEKLAMKGVLLLHNNAPDRNSRVVVAAPHKVGFEFLNHPPYSQDLAPTYSQKWKK